MTERGSQGQASQRLCRKARSREVRQRPLTFSTSALVTLMSASIFSKYCCARSASLQSRSNLLLLCRESTAKNAGHQPSLPPLERPPMAILPGTHPSCLVISRSDLSTYLHWSDPYLFSAQELPAFTRTHFNVCTCCLHMKRSEVNTRCLPESLSTLF